MNNDDVISLEELYDEESESTLQEDIPNELEGEPVKTDNEDNEGNDLDSNDEPESIVDPIIKFLEDYGYAEGTIPVENEEGETENIKFSELSTQEQYAVLSQLNEVDATDTVEESILSEDEESILSYLRENDMTFDELVEQEALRLSRSLSSAGIDDMSDDDVYLDFLNRTMPNSDEDEIMDELEHSKSSPLYAKKVAALREQGKLAEQQERELAEQQETLAQQKEIEEIKNNIVASAVQMQQINDFALDNETKNVLIEQLTELEDNGNSSFVNSMSSPDNMIKAAWYLTYGEAAFSALHAHYAKEIEKAREDGKAEAAKGFPSKPIKKGTSAVKAPLTQEDRIPTQEELFED